MKKSYKITVIILMLLGMLHVVTKNNMPVSPPDIIVRTDNNRIETAKGEYNWFDGRDGGNSCLSDSYDNLLETLESTRVELGQKIEFSFKTSWQQPERNSLYLLNFDEDNHVQLDEQDLNYNQFYAPDKAGEYNFLIVSYWDETHTVTNLIKINVA